MTTETAGRHIITRMHEMGVKEYYTRHRHIVLSPLETKTEDAPGLFLVLAEPNECIRIESEGAVFDLSEMNANNLQYEHQGKTTLINHSAITQHVIMLQAIYQKQ